MKKINYIITITLLIISANIYAQSAYIDTKKGIVTVYNFNYDFDCSSGNDSVEICYPKNWTNTTGVDGRKVTYPRSGWTFTTGTDGRSVAYPSTGWTFTTGTDGRSVAYPSTGWTFTTGTDGRTVTYPWSGWTFTTGTDGRTVTYPWSGWTFTTGTDGRTVTYPQSWSKEEGEQGFKITNYSDGTNMIEFIFREVQYLPLLEAYGKKMDKSDFVDFIAYTFIERAREDGINITLKNSGNNVTTLPISNNPTNNQSELDRLIDEINNTCGTNSSLTNGQCYCNVGYIWQHPNDPKNYDCKKNSITPTNNTQSTTPTNTAATTGGSLNIDTIGITPIMAANSLGSQGYITLRNTPEEYQLDSNVLRQEIIGIALKLRGVTTQENYACRNVFKDVSSVKPNTWVCRVAENAAKYGIVTNTNPQFNPESYVTLSEALAMVLNSLSFGFSGYIDHVNDNHNFTNMPDWQKSVMAYSIDYEIIPKGSTNPNKIVTRGEVFQLISRALLSSQPHSNSQ